MNITLFVPVLNELEGLKSFMPAIPKGMFQQILIVDGNSSDGSAYWASAAGFEVHTQRNSGIRQAYIEGWPLIRGDFVITFSPDGNCKTEDLEKIVSLLREGNEMVIASRYLKPAFSEDDTALTGLGNWLFTRLINFLHGSKYTDAMTIYRGYEKSLFYRLDLDKNEAYWVENLFFTRIGIEPLLSIRAAKAKVRTSEVPSVEPKRVSGKAKVQPFRWGAAFLSQTLLELFFWRPRGPRPVSSHSP